MNPSKPRILPVILAPKTRATLLVGACLLLTGSVRAADPVAPAAANLQAPALVLLERAKETARQIDDPDAAGPAWAEIASALALAGDVAGAKKLVGNVADYAWKAEILKAVAQAQVRRDDLVGAIATANAIGEDDAKSEALLDVALAYVKANDVPRAKQVLASARLALVSEYLGGLAPRMACVQAAVGDPAAATRSLLATSGDLDRALAHCELIAGLALGGNGASARQRLVQARAQVSALAEGAPRNRALVKLVAAQSSLGDTDAAMKTATEITEARGRTDAYLEIADRSTKLSVRRDAYRKAWSSAEGILQNVTRAVAWCRIGNVASACGESEDAVELLRKGREAAEALTDPRDLVRGLATVVKMTPGKMLGAISRMGSREAPVTAAFKSLVQAGLRSPRPGFSVPSGADRPVALAGIVRSLVAQVEPLAAGRSVEAERLKGQIDTSLDVLTEALRASDAPRVELALAELTGTPTDPTCLLKTLEVRLALAPEQVDSLEEERSLNAFLLARELLGLLRPSGATPERARLGLAVRELRLALASVSLGSAEREVIVLPLPSGKRTLGELLAVLDTFAAGEETPSVEKLVPVVREALEQLTEDGDLPERARHPRVILALGALLERLAALDPKPKIEDLSGL